MNRFRWSLKVGRNVSIVPIIPGRVAFALLAARAFAEWDAELHDMGAGPIDDQDIVAISLPKEAQDEYIKALNDLPRPSILFLKSSQQDGDDYREIVSVAPTDGFTEAARQAHERGCALHFIDIPIDPSQLVKDCASAFPPSFDDGSVLAAGVQGFLRHFAELFSRSAIRREPADSFREYSFASTIQELTPTCRHLFVFCSAPLVQNLVQMLPCPQAGAHFPRPRRIGPSVTRYLAGETVFLRDLDDFPNFSEVFEDLRCKTFPLKLDRMNFVEECLLRAVHADPSDKVSLRRLGVMMAYLRALCNSADRCSPGPDQIVAAIIGTLPRTTAERVLSKLYSFQSTLDLKAEITGGNNFRLIRRRHVAPVDQLRVVRRDCSPTDSNTVMVPIDRRVTLPNPDEGRNRSWHPDDFHTVRLERVRRRVIQHAIFQGGGIISQEFRGSLEMGLDLRRSVRSLSGDDKIFVRLKSSGLRPSQILSAPIIWVLRPAAIGSISTETYSAEVLAKSLKAETVDNEDEYVRFQRVASNHTITRKYSSPHLVVAYAHIVGWVNYGPFYGEFKAEQLRGARLENRMPNHRSMEHPTGVGCLASDLKPIAHQRRWDELLLLSAMRFTERCIIVVAPAEYDPGERVRHALAGRKLVLLRVNLDSLRHQEIFWLSRYPVAQGETDRYSREQFETEIWPDLEAVWAN